MRIALFMLVLSPLLACEGEEKHIANPPRSIIASEEFEPGMVGTVEQIDGQDASLLMTGEAGLQVNGTDIGHSDDLCLLRKLENIVSSADPANISFRSKIDLRECFQDGIGSIPADRAEMEILAWFGCDDGALKDFNGKTLDKVETVGHLCADGSVVGQMINVSLNIHLKGIVNTGIVEIELRAMSALQGASGACSYRKSGQSLFYGNECLFLDKARYDTLRINGEPTALDGQESFLKLGFRDIVERLDAGQWYESGAMDVVLNNWTGEVRYSGDNVSPSWSLSDGKSTISGTMESSAFGLVKRTKQRLAEKLQRFFEVKEPRDF